MKLDEATDALSRHFITRHGDLFDKHFPAELDEQSMILKAHLLLEAALRDFCANCVAHPEHLVGARFQFSQVLSLARALCPTVLNDYSEMLWTIAKNLNSLRNVMAHELEPDEAKLAKHKAGIVDLLNKHDNGNRELRECLEYTLGSFNAFLHVALHVGQFHEDRNE